MPILTGSIPKTLMDVGRSRKPAAMPGDAAHAGTPADLRRASKHKKAVSAALHLKKESVGHRGNPSGYGAKSLAFPVKLKG